MCYDTWNWRAFIWKAGKFRNSQRIIDGRISRFAISPKIQIRSFCTWHNLRLISVYVDAGEGISIPITLSVVTSGPNFKRNWKIKITQIPCNVPYKGKCGGCNNIHSKDNYIFLLYRAEDIETKMLQKLNTEAGIYFTIMDDT